MEAPTTVPDHTQCLYLKLSPTLPRVDLGGADVGGKLSVITQLCIFVYKVAD